MRLTKLLSVGVLVSALGGIAGAAKVEATGKPETHYRPHVMQQTDGRLRVEVWAADGATKGRAKVRVDIGTPAAPRVIELDRAMRVVTRNGRAIGVARIALPEGAKVANGQVIVSHRWQRADGSAILNYQQPTEREPSSIGIGATRPAYIFPDR